MFWTYKKIYFYKLSKKEYILYQTIDESIDKPEKDYKNYHLYMYRSNQEEYTINSIYQLKNCNIISCYSDWIKIYTKKNDKYTLLSKINTDIEVQNVIEIEPNKLFLMQKDFESGGFCSQTYYCIHTYSLSLYDIEINSLSKLNKFEESVSLKYNDIISFNNDKYYIYKIWRIQI